MGIGGGNAGERRLDDEECGTDENADEDEDESLFFDEVIDGTWERSGVFEAFGGVGGCLIYGDLFVSPMGCV